MFIHHRMMTTAIDKTAVTTSVNCIPCSGLDDNDLIPIDIVKGRILQTIPIWTLFESNDKNKSIINVPAVSEIDNNTIANYYSIYRKFTTKNFQSAMDCINAIGILAEEQNHHPNLHITNYRDVMIEIYSHKLNGITENDIQLAHLIDTNVAIEYSPKWLKSHPEATCTSKSL
jgi:pterin-4a-carbinolamine dehydratase